MKVFTTTKKKFFSTYYGWLDFSGIHKRILFCLDQVEEIFMSENQ